MTAIIVIFTALLVIEWVVSLDHCDENIGRTIYDSVKVYLFVIILEYFSKTP